jgi:hypothetical protein
MKLNRIMLGATAAVLVVGSTALVGYNREADPQTVVAEQTAVEQQADSLDQEGATQNASTTTDVGVESYAHGGGSHGGGSHGGGAHAGAAHGGGFHGGGHGFEHGGFGHGGYGRGYGHGYNHGGWAGGGRWGRWGGGRYVGGRYVGGSYYGWCNDRYYSCNRAWY